ncbi:MAG TPA: helix-turn-helix domain-containing protein [Polyangiaceae bacterium]|nr:helix-turn-helix domain-containing protein [Polyangiaceae bacterium]
MKRRARPAPTHRRRSAELPRHWVTLPAAAQRAAQRHPLLAGLFPSHVGFFPKARHQQVERAGIPPTIVSYCVKGAGFFELAGRRFSVEPGDVMVVPGGAPHRFGTRPGKRWSIYWVHAQGTHLPALLAELGVNLQRPTLRLGYRRDLVALFSELRASLEDDDSEPRLLYASRVLTHLLGVMIRARHESSPAGAGTTSRVRATIEHMRVHYAAPLRVEALASMADLSTSQYAVRFRELTGDSPKNYLMRLRIHRATQLLDTTSDSISDIARSVGYDDPLYFSRAFRRLHEVSPSGYRDGLARPRVALARGR